MWRIFYRDIGAKFKFELAILSSVMYWLSEKKSIMTLSLYIYTPKNRLAVGLFAYPLILGWPFLHSTTSWQLYYSIWLERG